MGGASTSLESLRAEVSSLRRENIVLEQKLEASEAARQECDERFRDLAENIQEVFWIDTPDLTKTLYVSPAYEEIWGCSCQSLYENSRSFIDAIHPHDRDRITTRIQSQSWEGFCEEYRIIRPDGEIRWIRDRAWPVRDESGKTIRVVGIAQDISSNKAAEASLRKYEQMVSTTPDLMAFVDTNYRYQSVNKSYAEVFGKPQEFITGRLVADILGSVKFDEIKPFLDECLSGKLINYQHWIDTPKEGKRYFDVYYHPAVNSDGSVFGVVADVRDLTDLKLAEKKVYENQIFLNSIVENIPHMIFVKDVKDLRFLRFNKAGEELVGYPKEAMIGKT
ncbi:MAG: PAS domain S-box protein, partial [Nitrospirota bacterium]|nr:PAS domain S-box protein [Nitrospirota bacterium]